MRKRPEIRQSGKKGREAFGQEGGPIMKKKGKKGPQ